MNEHDDLLVRQYIRSLELAFLVYQEQLLQAMEEYDPDSFPNPGIEVNGFHIQAFNLPLVLQRMLLWSIRRQPTVIADAILKENVLRSFPGAELPPKTEDLEKLLKASVAA